MNNFPIFLKNFKKKNKKKKKEMTKKNKKKNNKPQKISGIKNFKKKLSEGFSLKKKFLEIPFLDKKEINLDINQKRNFSFFAKKELKENENNFPKISSFFFFGLKSKFSLSRLNQIFDSKNKKNFSEFSPLFFLISKLEKKKGYKILKYCLYQMILINFFSLFSIKEYFRLEIFFFKKIFFFFYRYIKKKKILKIKTSLNKVFSKIYWTFHEKLFNFQIGKIFIQILFKEIWFLKNFFFSSKKLFYFLGRKVFNNFPILKISFLFLLPKIDFLKNFPFEAIIKNNWDFYSQFPFSFGSNFFRKSIREKKKKVFFFEFLPKNRNFFQEFKICFINKI
ncbi:hypothetical protein HAN_3g411 (nucleomorph) [Hemiselmis andersenii]|uniref:Uncharacterized protein n=2 Tax=Hemiselmis andersenii TaxID=464988 RepID=A9BL38_HEMAN|nr:hypothetical protein HAN_3g411 [Hemiselmis andersenii]ABW98221.1 hypothetical protein HAN_3g411 [Hemiselmis andersenii]